MSKKFLISSYNKRVEKSQQDSLNITKNAAEKETKYTNIIRNFEKQLNELNVTTENLNEERFLKDF